MRWEGKYAVDNPVDEYEGLMRYLEKMELFEEGMSLQEMQDLSKTLQESLTSHVQPTKIDTIEDLDSILGDDDLKPLDAEDNFQSLTSYCKEEENWDDEDVVMEFDIVTFYRPKTLSPENNNNNTYTFKADVHHELDWDPVKQESEEIVDIKFSNSRKRRVGDFHFCDLDAIKTESELTEKDIKRKKHSYDRVVLDY